MKKNINPEAVDTCQRKHKYFTPKEASKARKDMIRSIGDVARKLQVYQCTVCNQYHLGKPTKNQILKQKLRKRRLEDQEEL